MKNKVKRNLILALTTLTIGGIATIPNFVFAIQRLIRLER